MGRKGIRGYAVQFDRLFDFFPNCGTGIFFDATAVQVSVAAGCQLLFLHELESAICTSDTDFDGGDLGQRAVSFLRREGDRLRAEEKVVFGGMLGGEFGNSVSFQILFFCGQQHREDFLVFSYFSADAGA